MLKSDRLRLQVLQNQNRLEREFEKASPITLDEPVSRFLPQV